MRRLLVIVCAIVLVDTMLYAALTPLLPGYADEFGLSKTGAGLLVATYAIGVLAGALPAGFGAARLGPRRAAILGLALIAVATIGFAVAGDVWTLGGARLVQGFGSALSWSGGLAWLVALSPRERRGELLGTALAAAIFGALLGPVLGGAASLVGTRTAFVAVGLATAALALVSMRSEPAPAERADASALARGFRERSFVGGLWLMFLPALLFGVLAVLIPLELDALGWGAVAIGAVFLVSAGVEAVITPLTGRLSDRRGGLGLVRVALLASVAISLALAWSDTAALVTALVVAAAVAYGALFAPAMVFLADGAERAVVPQTIGFGLMNAAWAGGALLGSWGGGALGEVGDTVAYAFAAGVCAATLVAIIPPLGAFGTPASRVPERP